MKFYVKGEITRNEFIKIGKFFRDLFKDTDRVVHIIVSEGTQHMTKEQVANLLIKIFEDSPHYKITTIKKLGEFDE